MVVYIKTKAEGVPSFTEFPVKGRFHVLKEGVFLFVCLF